MLPQNPRAIVNAKSIIDLKKLEMVTGEEFESSIPTILAETDFSIIVPNVESYQARPPGHCLFVFVLFSFIKNVFSFLSCDFLFFLLYKCRFQVILGYSSVFFRYLSQLMLICLLFGSLKALI